MNTYPDSIKVTAEALLPGDLLAHRGSTVRHIRVSTRSMTRGSVIITADLPDGTLDVFVVSPGRVLAVTR